jgi:hypothetical protein
MANQGNGAAPAERSTATPTIQSHLGLRHARFGEAARVPRWVSADERASRGEPIGASGASRQNVVKQPKESCSLVAPSSVRAAGQYKKNQGEVWSKVGESNAVHGTSSASGTFLATVDDPAITGQRRELAGQIDVVLGAVKPQEDVVGIAYAIDGDVRGVRWFAHHAVFELVRKKLVTGIAFDAIVARAEAEAQHRAPSTKPAPAPAAVDAFVKNVEDAAVKEQRDTAAGNVNEYKESSQAYGSKTMFKGASSKPGASPKKPVSSDFTAK